MCFIAQAHSSSPPFKSWSFTFVLSQEEQQRRSLEQLFSADRHSLLAEVRSLHAQLHESTQQSGEQLRQLQDSLHAVKEQETRTQQQLHRDRELCMCCVFSVCQCVFVCDDVC